MISNLINQAFGYVKQNVPGADQMYSKAIEQIKGNATPANMFSVLMAMAKSTGDYDKITKNKYFTIFENISKQEADKAIPFAENTVKELGVMPLITSFLGGGKQ